MTIVLTGAAGFIGRHVRDQLNASGFEVHALDHRWHDLEELKHNVSGSRVTGCIHLGWYSSPRDYAINVEQNAASMKAALQLADVAAQLGWPRIVAAGSCAEYGPADGPLSEAHDLRPRNVYAAAKVLTAELMRDRLGTRCDLVWARLFNVTGPGESPDRILPTVARRLRQRQAIELTHGRQLRDYVDVRDVAEALVHLLGHGDAGPVNVASGRVTTVAQAVTAVARHTGRVDLLRFDAVAPPPDDPTSVTADIGRIVATGWSPRFSMEDSARALVAAQ